MERVGLTDFWFRIGVVGWIRKVSVFYLRWYHFFRESVDVEMRELTSKNIYGHITFHVVYLLSTENSK